MTVEREGFAWRNRQTGFWLIYSKVDTHTGMKVKTSASWDIDAATVTPYLPHEYAEMYEPVKVRVRTSVEVIDD